MIAPGAVKRNPGLRMQHTSDPKGVEYSTPMGLQGTG